jgi:hypothetical protein
MAQKVKMDLKENAKKIKIGLLAAALMLCFAGIFGLWRSWRRCSILSSRSLCPG